MGLNVDKENRNNLFYSFRNYDLDKNNLYVRRYYQKTKCEYGKKEDNYI